MRDRRSQRGVVQRAPARAAMLSLCAALSALTAARALSPRVASAQDRAGDSAVTLDLPASGEVRIENQRGGVALEVWAEDYVAVAYTTGGATDSDAQASPVRLERADNSLAITIPRESSAAPATTRATSARAAGTRRVTPSRRAAASRPAGTTRGARATDPSVINLIVRVPARARVSVVTSGGAVEARGATARLDVQTVAGDVRLVVAPTADADIMARTLYGSITAGAGLGANDERTLRERFAARLGAGTRIVRLSTVCGHVSLEQSAQIADAPATADARSPTRTDARRATPGVVDASPPVVSSSPRAPSLASSSSPAEAEQRRQPPSLVGASNRSAAQSPQPKPTPPNAPVEVGEDEVLTVDTSVVTLNFSVVDRQSGRALANLIGADFKVSEDNVEQQITHFEQASAPFDLVLLLDLSGSTAHVTDLIRGSARRFVDSVRANDRVGVIAFASATRVVSPLTSDKPALRARLDALGAPQGDTKLYDAINYSLEYLDKNSPKERRRAVVLLTDGLDSSLPNVTGDGSKLPYAELKRRVQEFDGLFYAVVTDNYEEPWSSADVQPETYDMAWDRMEELTKEAGGLFYEAEAMEDVADMYARVVEDLGTVYSVSYVPTNKARDGTWRTVKVRLPRRPEAVARGRSGYYAK